ncbi:hypothetical protein [Parapedobacter tibetensis]|uniref:hypothetical protein n=1 Tax=Parapedobacter tibetensis TaxID=2972951 RepID=UPI00214D3149|nr:hypothetical protein [Parapedobacter tibetensis]
MSEKNKKSINYRYSDETLKTSKEFSYATRLASALKTALSPLVFGNYGNELHKRLQSRIIAVLSTGPTEKKGERTLADGNLALLKGLELNPYTSFSWLTHAIFIKADIVPIPDGIKIQLPAMGRDNFKWPERGAEAYLSIRCIVLDVRELTVDVYALEPLAFAYGHKKKQQQRSAVVPIENMEDRLALVAVGVSFLRTDGAGGDGLISNNRKYYAAYLAEAAYVKNGEVVVFEGEQAPKTASQPEAPNVKIVKWDED